MGSVAAPYSFVHSFWLAAAPMSQNFKQVWTLAVELTRAHDQQFCCKRAKQKLVRATIEHGVSRSLRPECRPRS